MAAFIMPLASAGVEGQMTFRYYMVFAAKFSGVCEWVAPTFVPPFAWTPKDNGDINQTTRHVPNTGGVVKNLIKCYITKTPKHELNHGSHSHHRSPDSKSEKGSLTDGCIDNFIGIKFFQKSL